MKYLSMLLLLMSSLGAQVGPQDDPRYVKKRAERYMARLDFNLAIKYLSDAQKRIPEDGEIRILLGECYFAKSKWSEAARAFLEGVEKNQKLVGCVSHLPLALIRANQLDRAEVEAKVLAEKGRNERARANGWFCRGLISWHRGRLDDANKNLREALRHDTSIAKAHYRLGLVLGKQKDLVGAIASYKATLKLNPLHHASAHNLALLHRRLKKVDDAKAWRLKHQEIVAIAEEVSRIKSALERTPNQIPLVRKLADIYFANGLYQEAVMPYSACVAAAPKESEPRYLYAASLFQVSDFHGARLQLNQVLARNPKHEKARALQEKIHGIAEDKKDKSAQ